MTMTEPYARFDLEVEPMTCSEAARFLRVPARDLHQAALAGQVPAHRKGKFFWFTRMELREFLAQPHPRPDDDVG